MAEFRTLPDLALNLESGGAAAWGNFGDWSRAGTYPEAAAALADRLAHAVQLGADHRVIDVGFGGGDQLLHWIERFGVSQLAGLNLDAAQTAVAIQRLGAAGQPGIARQLREGGAERLVEHAWPWPPDLVLALDCAYHFRTRKRFLADAAQLLPPGGRLGLTDIALARPPGLLAAVPLRAMAAACAIPWANLRTAAQLRADWEQAGFEIIEWRDISAEVLDGFARWYGRYRRGLDAAQRRAHRWLRYDVTAAALRLNARRGLLRYLVCAGRRR